MPGLGPEIRKARGGTPATAFAARVGVSLNTLYRWERGATIPGSEGHVEALEREGVSRASIEAARAEQATKMAAQGDAA